MAPGAYHFASGSRDSLFFPSMGRQIQILLSNADEQKLIEHVTRKYPHFKVVSQRYPEDWNRQSLVLNADDRQWLIIDDRTSDILIRSANQITEGPLKSLWQVRSKAFSCIEWDRGEGVDQGRLYLNTDSDPIWMDISAKSGDKLAGMFRSACLWVRSNCVNCSEYRYGIWVSHCIEKEFRNARAKNHAKNIQQRQLFLRGERE